MPPGPPAAPNDGHPWKILKPGTDGPLTRRANGDWSFGDMEFSQDIRISEMPIGDSVVNKEAGPGGKITIKAPDQIHYLVFQSGYWFYRVEKRGFFSRLFG
jgi:hypothetical protein